MLDVAEEARILLKKNRDPDCEEYWTDFLNYSAQGYLENKNVFRDL